MLKYLGTVGVPVSDQDKALDFYVNTLGFEKVQDEPMGEGSRWVTVVPPGAQTNLVLEQGYEGSRQPGGFLSYIFHSDNLQETYETLNARGVNFTVPPKIEPWGGWAQFTDPDGNEFGIHSNP